MRKGAQSTSYFSFIGYNLLMDSFLNLFSLTSGCRQKCIFEQLRDNNKKMMGSGWSPSKMWHLDILNISSWRNLSVRKYSLTFPETSLLVHMWEMSYLDQEERNIPVSKTRGTVSNENLLSFSQLTSQSSYSLSVHIFLICVISSSWH